VASILVVDDDACVRALLRGLLEAEGHEVRTVDDGFQALRAVPAQRPDCVLLDVRMPGMDGHEVLARLRALDGGGRLPVVMLTAADDDATAWRAWEGGADRLLPKPVDAGVLLRQLQHVQAAAARAHGGRRRRC
jgi:CheY-like chemotaxis protein